jgi:hypothetical protein
LFEFYPTGIHTFPKFFDIFGGITRQLFGYRLGTISNLIFLYGVIYLSYKIIKLFFRDFKITKDWLTVFLFINIFISFEAFFQLPTYFVDIISEFFVLLAVYFLFKFFLTPNLKWIYLSSLIAGLSILGKYTNIIYVIPLVLIVTFNAVIFQKYFKFYKFKNLLIMMILISTPFLLSGVPNFKNTGNPVFPFYNGILKSKYFELINFENPRFGALNLKEKLLWPIYSLANPTRLGEGHDLANDYKLNIYYAIAILSIIGSLLIKDGRSKFFSNFNLYFILSFMMWNFTFGYLRYALILETVGGILLVLWWQKIKTFAKGNTKNIATLFVIVFSLLFFRGDKVALNLGLAYDLSWRKSFWYNNTDYIKELKNIFKNNIYIYDQSFNPDIYLNCALPNTAYYTLSNFKHLPMLNIDIRTYSGLTLNKNYINVTRKKLKNYTNKSSQVKFITITGNEGLIDNYHECLTILKYYNYNIEKEIELDNFLGYNGQKLVVIFGKLDL